MPETLRILLVEDCESDARLLSALLADLATPSRYDLSWVRGVEEARAKLAGHEAFDVVLSDYRLPDGNAHDLVRSMGRACERARVIVLSGHPEDTFESDPSLWGVSDFLEKGSFDEAMLHRVIRYAVAHARALEELEESQLQYRELVTSLCCGLWDWNLEDDTVFYSRPWKSMLGLLAEEVGDSPDEWLTRIHEEDRERVLRAIEHHKARPEACFVVEHRVTTAGGDTIWVEARGQAVLRGGRAVRLVGSLVDVSERKRVEEELVHQTFHDPLTGLPNRTHMLTALDRCVARSGRRQGMRFAVLVMDLDRFKSINDTLGHGFGDQLIVMVARRLKSALRPEDLIARMGGDEFAILLEDIREPSDVLRIAERVRRLFDAPLTLDGQEFHVQASTGIAISEPGYQSSEELLRDADTAMYRAKAAGGGRHEMFKRDMHSAAVGELELETDLRKALTAHELIAHFQPIVELETGRIRAYEALMRWEHPTRGFVSPMDFIAVAESTGLIHDLGRSVLRQSCENAVRWKESLNSHAPYVTVNVSGKQILSSDFPETATRILETVGLPPESLVIEITENVLLEGSSTARDALLDLRSNGIRIFLDDFGTGYSSLSCLNRFPVDALKIDRSFLRAGAEGGRGWRIVESIVWLASRLGMGVVAEGVETEEDRQRLLSIGCERAQGFYFSRPVPGAVAAEQLAAPQPCITPWALETETEPAPA